MSDSRYITEYVSSFFREELKLARDLSDNTYRSYKIAIKSFITFLEGSLQKRMFQLTGDDISYELVYDWMLDQSVKKNWSHSTWNSRLAAMRTFLQFLGRENIRYLDLNTRVGLIKNKSKVENPADYMTLEEFNNVLKKIDSNNYINFRDKLIFQVLFFSGARVAELTSLRTQDVMFLKCKNVSLYFMGKGRKARNVTIKEKATIQNIKKYLQFMMRNELSSEYFFPGQNGNRMSEKNISRIIRKHFSNLGQKVISPHSFRHSAAMHWLESGMEIFAVSALLGHKDVKATIIYLRSTFKVKSDALDACGQNNKLSEIFKPKFSTNEEFWDHLGVSSMIPA